MNGTHNGFKGIGNIDIDTKEFQSQNINNNSRAENVEEQLDSTNNDVYQNTVAQNNTVQNHQSQESQQEEEEGSTGFSPFMKIALYVFAIVFLFAACKETGTSNSTVSKKSVSTVQQKTISTKTPVKTVSVKNIIDKAGQGAEKAVATKAFANKQEISDAFAGKLIIWDQTKGRAHSSMGDIKPSIKPTVNDDGKPMVVAVYTGDTDEVVGEWISKRSGAKRTGYRRVANIILVAMPIGKIIGNTKIEGDKPNSTVRTRSSSGPLYGAPPNFEFWANNYPNGYQFMQFRGNGN